MTRLPWRKKKYINKEKKKRKKTKQPTSETKSSRHGNQTKTGGFIVTGSCDGQKASAYLINWYWLVLDTSSHSFTTTTKKKNLLAFRRKTPGSRRCSGSTRGEKVDLTFFSFFFFVGSIKGRSEERTLGNGRSLSKLEERLWTVKMSLLPKTQSSAWENMATSEVKLSDSKKLRIYMHANQNHPICF